MQTLLVMPRDSEELSFISEMFAKMNIRAKVLSTADSEDTVLLEIMNESDRTQKVSRETIMNQLR